MDVELCSYGGGSLSGVILLARRHVTMSRDIFGVHSREEGSYWHLAGRRAARCRTMYRSAPFLPVQ